MPLFKIDFCSIALIKESTVMLCSCVFDVREVMDGKQVCVNTEVKHTFVILVPAVSASNRPCFYFYN